MSLDNRLVAKGTQNRSGSGNCQCMVRGAFCHRSYMRCDKMLVSIATSSLVPLHAVRQKAWLTPLYLQLN